MRKIAAIVCLGLAPGLAASADDDIRPTVSVDVGLGAMYLRNETAKVSSDVHPGVVFGAQLGALVAPSIALCARVLALRGGTTDNETVLSNATTTFLGARVEYRPATP